MSQTLTKSMSAVAAIVALVRQEDGEASLRRIAALSVISGALETAVLMVLAAAAQAAGDPSRRLVLLYYFVIVFLLWFVSVREARYVLSAVMQRIVTHIRLRVVQKARQADLRSFERIGHSELLVQFTDDTEAVAEASRELALVAGRLVVLVCCVGYIAWRSLPGFVLVAAVLVAGGLAYIPNLDMLWKLQVEFREKLKDIFVDIKHFLFGFKELRIDDRKSDAFFHDGFKSRVATLLEVKLRLGRHSIRAYVLAMVVWYALLAMVAFVLPQVASVRPEDRMVLVAAVLFLPVDVFMAAIPFINRASVSIERMKVMERSLDRLAETAIGFQRRSESAAGPAGAASHSSSAPAPPGAAPEPAPLADFRVLRAEQVAFRYHEKGDENAFELGPADFELRRNEIVFVTGGNGYGKTTLLKLVLGLYEPSEGRFLLDGCETPGALRRGLFAAVFSDYYLFDRLYGLGEVGSERVNWLLHEVRLDHKTRFENGRFTTLDLSSGQRRRLALVCALLEDKPVIAFDEWAADQDPEFRRHFYREVLPGLKRAGKTVIAVTHDDTYYDAADRLIQMDYGRIC